jgi:hypothetical protein
MKDSGITALFAVSKTRQIYKCLLAATEKVPALRSKP